MSTNLEYRAKERQGKRESSRQASKLNEKKGDRDLEQEIKNKGVIVCWKNNAGGENFVAAVTK